MQANHSLQSFQISHLYVDNFKSLVDFHLPLTKFSCLIGLNGSGKSTVLQAVDFISRISTGEVSYWLDQRQWEPVDLNSKLTVKNNINFTTKFMRESETLLWKGSFNRTLRRCTQESVVINEESILVVNEGQCKFKKKEGVWSNIEMIPFEYEGSILSLLKSEVLDETILSIKDFLKGAASLDLLAPQLLRKKTNRSGGELGLGGERLSAFLHELSPDRKRTLESQLKECYPQLSRFSTRSLRAGWKELRISESFGSNRLVTESKHVNDGMLRMMAILAELLTDHKFLLFDEIENGINAELVDFLLTTLMDSRQQVLVTTHSPMILNYLEDKVARTAVQYLYRTPEGYTRSIRFFDIPSVSQKLEVMGPGEAFVDTALPELQEEIEGILKSRG